MNIQGRPTPETDAATESIGWGHGCGPEWTAFARNLERQRDAARDEIEVHKAFGKVAIAERNLAWHREDELKRQRDVLREALELDIEFHSHPFIWESEPKFRNAGYTGPASKKEMVTWLESKKQAILAANKPSAPTEEKSKLSP